MEGNGFVQPIRDLTWPDPLLSFMMFGSGFGSTDVEPSGGHFIELFCWVGSTWPKSTMDQNKPDHFIPTSNHWIRHLSPDPILKILGLQASTMKTDPSSFHQKLLTWALAMSNPYGLVLSWWLENVLHDALLHVEIKTAHMWSSLWGAPKCMPMSVDWKDGKLSSWIKVRPKITIND